MKVGSMMDVELSKVMTRVATRANKIYRSYACLST
jgi:hypothetical protein